MISTIQQRTICERLDLEFRQISEVYINHNIDIW